VWPSAGDHVPLFRTKEALNGLLIADRSLGNKRSPVAWSLPVTASIPQGRTCVEAETQSCNPPDECSIVALRPVCPVDGTFSRSKISRKWTASAHQRRLYAKQKRKRGSLFAQLVFLDSSGTPSVPFFFLVSARGTCTPTFERRGTINSLICLRLPRPPANSFGPASSTILSAHAEVVREARQILSALGAASCTPVCFFDGRSPSFPAVRQIATGNAPHASNRWTLRWKSGEAVLISFCMFPRRQTVPQSHRDSLDQAGTALK